MKIAFIVDAFPSLSETFLLNQITGILDLGHEIDIFAKTNPHQKKVHSDVKKYNLIKKTYYIPKIPQNKIIRILKAILLITKNFAKNPITLIKALNFFKFGNDALSLRNLYCVIPFLDKHYDIIHCHFGPSGIIGAYLKDIGIQGKYITSFHGYDVNSYPQIMGKDIYDNLFAKGDLFTVNTNFTKQKVVKLGCNKKKIVVLPVGLNIEKFKFSPKEIKSGESIKILTIARLVEKKGHEYALKAISKIATKQKKIIYLIAGDGPLRNKLESLVLKYGIQNYVKFLNGIEQDEALNLYQQAHIFLLPSVTARNGDREGQTLVLQEAQAVGMPVISTIHNGIPEGVQDGRSGFLVPERDIEALVDRLVYLIKNKDLWPDMGRAGREFVEKNYNIKKLNKRLVEIYQELIKQS